MGADTALGHELDIAANEGTAEADQAREPSTRQVPTSARLGPEAIDTEQVGGQPEHQQHREIGCKKRITRFMMDSIGITKRSHYSALNHPVKS